MIMRPMNAILKTKPEDVGFYRKTIDYLYKVFKGIETKTEEDECYARPSDSRFESQKDVKTDDQV